MDIVRVQDVGLRRADDLRILDWAVTDKRVLLTHDLRTIPKFVYERMAAGLPTPGVVIIVEETPTGQAIEELELLLGATFDTEWDDRVHHVPSR